MAVRVLAGAGYNARRAYTIFERLLALYGDDSSIS